MNDAQQLHDNGYPRCGRGSVIDGMKSSIDAGVRVGWGDGREGAKNQTDTTNSEAGSHELIFTIDVVNLFLHGTAHPPAFLLA